MDFNKISVVGISDVELEDINYAKKLGYKIKHLAVAEKSENGVELRVGPTLVSETDMLSKVDEEMNAIRLEGNMLGSLLMSGAGAGAAQLPLQYYLISLIQLGTRKLNGHHLSQITMIMNF